MGSGLVDFSDEGVTYPNTILSSGDVFTQAVVGTVGPLGQRCWEQRVGMLQGRQALCWDWFILSPTHEQLPQSQANWWVAGYGDREKKAMGDAWHLGASYQLGSLHAFLEVTLDACTQ